MRFSVRWLPIMSVAVLPVASGCGEQIIEVWREFPDVGLGETLVLVHGTAADRQATVYEPGAGPDDAVVQAPSGSLDPIALVFSRRATDVRLPLGRQPVVSEAEGGRLLFGAPTAFFREQPIGVEQLQRRQDPPSAIWRSVPLPTELQSLAVPSARAPCPQFAQPLWSETLPDYAEAIVERIDEESALLVGRAIEGADARWVVSTSTASMRTPVGSGEQVNVMTRVGHKLWLGDLFGRLWEATPDRTLGWRDRRPLPIPALDVPLFGMATTGTTSDVFVSTGLEIAYYDGRRWRVVGRGRAQDRYMVSTGLAEALFIDDRTGRLVRATPEGLLSLSGAPTSLHSLQLIEGVPVVGNELGEFFAQTGDEWTRVVPDNGWFGLSATGYEDGLAFYLASGVGAFYSDSTGICRDLFVITFSTDGRILALGEDLLAVANRANSDALTVTWVPRN